MFKTNTSHNKSKSAHMYVHTYVLIKSRAGANYTTCSHHVSATCAQHYCITDLREKEENCILPNIVGIRLSLSAGVLQGVVIVHSSSRCLTRPYFSSFLIITFFIVARCTYYVLRWSHSIKKQEYRVIHSNAWSHSQ